VNPFSCLLKLQWLTGDDGRISFSKLVLVVLIGMVGVLVWHIVDSPSLTEALWPLVWLFALLLAGSHGIKGLQLWFSAARLKTEGRSSINRVVIERRNETEGIDPSP
jgi:hypothetical protein